jgi:hypothetical protein
LFPLDKKLEASYEAMSTLYAAKMLGVEIAMKNSGASDRLQDVAITIGSGKISTNLCVNDSKSGTGFADQKNLTVLVSPDLGSRHGAKDLEEDLGEVVDWKTEDPQKLEENQLKLEGALKKWGEKVLKGIEDLRDGKYEGKNDGKYEGKNVVGTSGVFYALKGTVVVNEGGFHPHKDVLEGLKKKLEMLKDFCTSKDGEWNDLGLKEGATPYLELSNVKMIHTIIDALFDDKCHFYFAREWKVSRVDCYHGTDPMSPLNFNLPSPHLHTKTVPKHSLPHDMDIWMVPLLLAPHAQTPFLSHRPRGKIQ